MANFELSLNGHVAAAPGRVWAHLVDQEAIPCWLDGVSAVVMDGDEFLVHSGEESGLGWISGEVVEADPRRRLQIRLETPAANLIEARVDLTLTPEDGGTVFEMNVVGVPSFFGALMLPLLRLRTEVAMARAVRGFRAALEVRADRKTRPFDGPCPEQQAPRVQMARMAATAAV